MITAPSLRASLLLFAVFLPLCVGCGRGDPQPAPDGAAPAPSGAGPVVGDAERAEGKRIFETICMSCHGMEGHGDGPASASLEPKPRNLGDAQWQKTISDDHIRNVVTMGGAAVGKSPAMPAQPQLKGNPALEGLIAHVRSLAR